MSTIKTVIEVLASSPTSFEDALQQALTEASTTVGGISSIYIKDQSCKVEDNKIVEYRITAKVTAEMTQQQNSGASSAETDEVPEGGGAPDYSHIQIKTQPDLPREVEPGGSATEPESGGGYSG